MSIVVARRDGEAIIAVRGSLDAETGSKLLDLLHHVLPIEEASAVIIDLTHARDVAPLALAALVADGEAWTRVRLRGLSQHSHRILRHLAAEHHPG